RSPNSLMISAMRRPLAFCSRLRISVVLPAPRKPVMTVAGILAVSWIAMVSALLERQRQARGDEMDVARDTCHALVQGAGMVAEGPRHGVVGHDAEADL